MIKIRLSLLITAIALVGLMAFSISGVEAADVMMAKAKNPCASNPCAANPCAANPCAANPCSVKNPCSMKNPCAASSVIPLRAKAIKSRKNLRKMARTLWNDTSLGTAGVSCGTCHPKGQGLKKKPYPRYIKMPNDIVTLDQMINFCVLNPMKGKALAWNSEEMTALAAYVSFMSRRGAPAMNPCASKKNPCSMKNPCSSR
ncbi:MAG: cytochrome C peroxidase [Thermodesulfobacteriota bacterium]